jgi:hypothetical protein
MARFKFIDWLLRVVYLVLMIHVFLLHNLFLWDILGYIFRSSWIKITNLSLFWTRFKYTLRKNIFRSIIKNLNLALQDENPAFKDNNSKWGCKVSVVPTNSYGREYYQTITILIDSFNA